MKRIRCGVIGLGWFGEHHVDTLQQLPLVELAAVCTRTESRLKEVAGKYGVPKAYTDYKELLADKSIDMVSIVTHIKEHVAPTVDALAAGKHVFLEKPMADSMEDCDRIIAAAAKAGTCFMVGHICRFDTVYALAKEEIAAGNLGTILSMHARRNLAKWITPSHLKKISALFGDGVHDLDLMLWYSGAKPKSVYAQSLNTRPELPNDDLGWAMFRLDSGAIAVIENVWCLPENAPFAIDARMEIIGTKGAIYIDNSGTGYTVLKKEGLSYPQSTYWPKVHGLRRGFLKEELDYFTRCISEGRKPTVITPQESRLVVQAMKTAERSAKENRAMSFQS
jgi:UDP-N-acetylglucosamine 3-dehydrogenase